MRVSSYQIAAIATALGVIAPMTMATDPNPGIYRTQQNGNWNAASTWEVQVSNGVWADAKSYPQTGDTATILQHAVTMTAAATVATLTIQHDGQLSTGANELDVTTLDLDSASGGTLPAFLSVAASGVVEFGGSASATIDGDIDLEGSAAKLKINPTSSMTFSGSGRVKGEDNAAVIDILSGKTLQLASSFDVKGAMVIQGNGTFDNDGIVTADDASGGTLKLTVSTVSGSGAWQASGSGTPILRFEVDVPSGLSGNFTLLNGAWFQFYIDADVVTSGTFTGTCGKIDVDGGGSFQHSGGTVTSDTNYGGYPACS